MGESDEEDGSGWCSKSERAPHWRCHRQLAQKFFLYERPGNWLCAPLSRLWNSRKRSDPICQQILELETSSPVSPERSNPCAHVVRCTSQMPRLQRFESATQKERKTVCSDENNDHLSCFWSKSFQALLSLKIGLLSWCSLQCVIQRPSSNRHCWFND